MHVRSPASRRDPRRRRRRRLLPALALLPLALAVALAGAASGDSDPDAGPVRAVAATLPAPSPPIGALPVTVAVSQARPGRPIPASYLGLSFEATDLRRIAGYGEHGDLVALLRSIGPGLMRFGGVSADTRIAWTDAATPRPAWAGASLDAADFAALRRLAERSGWRILLTVGLAHYEPRTAAREVAVASRQLGPWLAGIEIGNEPDAYARHGLRGSGWGFGQYNAQVHAYRVAIARVAPRVPIAGPGVSGSHVFARWGPRVAAHERPLVLLTGHHYPLGCHQLPPPSIERLLSAQTRVEEGLSLRRYMAVARASGVPFRMDEANSVSCGGSAGISNTFAAALWATGYISQSLAAGVSGLNFEGNPANCLGYTALCAASAARLQTGALTAQPLWYALLLTKGLAGDRALHTAVAAPPGSDLLVNGFRAPDGTLQFVIVQYAPVGGPPAAITLQVGAALHTAAVLPLSASGPQATSGITLAGAAVRGDGALPGARPTEARVSGGAVTVTVPASSAALVTVAP